MREIERINPKGMQFNGMSQAVSMAGRILVSGQVALDANGKLVGVNDAAAQARQAFANIEKVLAAAGAKLSDVVKLTCYLTEKSAYNGFSEVRNRLFSEHPPASTVVIVSDLLLAGLLMEIEAEAWR